MSDDFLARSREKWRELPAGSETLGRTFSSELLALDTAALIERWQRMNSTAKAADDRGWFHRLYAESFAGKRIVEAGSGFGIDGIHFLTQGADWTFSDLVADNLAIVRRVVEHFGLGARAHYLQVQGQDSFAGLEGDYDAVWAIGALHHAPFDIARVESLDLLRHLKPGGRWIELTYPHERWLREGALPFSEFGKRTDGDRTPWAEWYDLPKVKSRLFPARTSTVLDFTFGGGNFGWIDLVVEDGPAAAGRALAPRSIDLVGQPAEPIKGQLKWRGKELAAICPPHLWYYCGRLDLRASVAELGALPQGLGHAVDLEVVVDSGSIGLVLTADGYDDFLGRERIIDARPQPWRVTLTTAEPAAALARLLIRNVAAGVPSRARILSASVRLSA
jgi:SAM-dependent methyltransferase